MSVDTKSIRKLVCDKIIPDFASIVMMCDEIDGLRKEIKRKDIQLENMKDLLRPRSIKDEPPPTDKVYLVYSNGAWRDRYLETAPGDKAWMPMLPDPPPQPDAFEEWAIERDLTEREKFFAKQGWDAALESIKK